MPTSRRRLITYGTLSSAAPLPSALARSAGWNRTRQLRQELFPCRCQTTHPLAGMRFVWRAITIPSGSSLFAIRGEKAGAIKPTAFFLDAYILDPNLANDLGVILTES